MVKSFISKLKKRAVVLMLSVSLTATASSMAVYAADVDSSKTYVISFEGLTLGQGMYVEPTEYTLDEVNALLKKGGIPERTSDNLSAALLTKALFVDKKIESQITGSWTSSFYLAAVKGFDKKKLNIPSIITKNSNVSNSNNDGNDDAYLGEFDYNNMSGWMITVNNILIGVGADAYVVKPGKNVRWMFTLTGYGADLGFSNETWGGSKEFFKATNKDGLYRAYAHLNKVYPSYLKNHSSVKNAATKVMENLTATQKDIDAQTSALKKAFTEASKSSDTKPVKNNFSVGSLNYRIIADGAVTCTGTNSPSSGVSIPAKVKFENKTYKVKWIEDKAFYGNKKITSLSIGKNVTTIGKSAFENCSMLKNISIGTGLTAIKAHAFCGIKKGAVITVNSTKWSSLGGVINDRVKNMTIKVPSKKLSAYKKMINKKNKGIKIKAK